MRRLLLLILFAPCSVWGIACDGDQVLEGDTKYAVLKACGEPDWRDGWREHVVVGREFAIEQHEASSVEQWYYNNGPQRLIRVFTFRDLRLAEITAAGYGFPESVRSNRCDPPDINLGMSKYEVQFRCGAPDFRDYWNGERIVRPYPGFEHHVLVHYDSWIYDFGSTRFNRILTFENGILRDVVTGERGGR